MSDVNIASLAEAIVDFRYLLNRGYNRQSALKLVGDRYQLSSTERNVLFRGVCSGKIAESRKSKIVPIEHIREKLLAIDGYNVLNTIESALAGKTLLLCDDGLVRDISAVHGKYKISELTGKALLLIFEIFELYTPRSFCFFLDSQVSKSGELASLIRSKISERELSGTAVAVKQADVSLLDYGEVVATSDSVIVDKLNAVVDIPHAIISRMNYKSVLDISNIK